MKKNSEFVLGLIGGILGLIFSIILVFCFVYFLVYSHTTGYNIHIPTFFYVWGILYIIHCIIVMWAVFLIKKDPYRAERIIPICMIVGLVLFTFVYILPSIFLFMALKKIKNRTDFNPSNVSKDKNFEDMVSDKKTIPTKSQILVQSYGEQKIADYLTDKDIDYNYDKQITLSFNEPNKNGHKQEWVRPDFYLNEFNIIIEYWGMKGDPDYDNKKDWKERVYAESKTKYISIYKEDLPDLEAKLETKLKRLGVNL